MALVRRTELKGSAEEWSSENPILLNGEVGYEEAENGLCKMKIGDGVKHWNELPYSVDFAAIKEQSDKAVSNAAAAEASATHAQVTANGVDGIKRQYAQLQAQVAANVAAHTDESQDYAAEVVDARVGNSGRTFTSLGEAKRKLEQRVKSLEELSGGELKGNFQWVIGSWGNNDRNEINFSGDMPVYQNRRTINQILSFPFDVEVSVNTDKYNAYGPLIFTYFFDDYSFSKVPKGSYMARYGTPFVIPANTQFIISTQYMNGTPSEATDDVYNVTYDFVSMHRKNNIDTLAANIDTLATNIDTLATNIVNNNIILCMPWAIGNLQGDAFDIHASNVKYRVTNSEFVLLSNKLFLIPKNDGKFRLVIYDENGAFVSATGWLKTITELPTNQKFKLLLSGSFDDTSAITDINNWVTQRFALQNEIQYSIQQQNSLPSYWQEYLPSKHEELQNKLLTKGKAESFIFFTDEHWESSAQHTPYIIKDIKDNTGIDLTLFGGDVLNMRTSQTKQEAKAVLWDFRKCEDTIGKMIWSLGNHERGTFNTLTGADNEMSANEAYTIFKNINQKTARLNKHFYFSYLNNTGIKYIVLDTSLMSWGQNEAEIQWYIDELNNTPERYTVVVLTHEYDKDNTNDKDITALAKAFKDRAAGSVRGVSYNFTNAVGDFTFVLAGHVHRDDSFVDNDILVIKTTTNAIYGGNASFDPNTRTENTVTEHAIDVFIVDTENRTVETVRYGSGEDRNFTY